MSESRQTHTKYQYRPLHREREEIRIITLLAAKNPELDEPIQCSIEHVSLSESAYTAEYEEWSKDLRDHVARQTMLTRWQEHVKSTSNRFEDDQNRVQDKPEFDPRAFRYHWGDYVSLSYIWGTSERTREIILDGNPFRVTENLYSALRNLQALFLGNDTRFWPKIWADALCIKQDDSDEQTREVARMRSIYSYAFAVIASIGSSFEDSDRALKLMREISPSIATGISYKVFKQDVENHRLLLELAEPILKVSYHPYWSRVWVIQELILAPDPVIITCGTSWAYLQDLRVVFLFLNLEMGSLVGDGMRADLAGKYNKMNSTGVIARYDVAKSVNRSLSTAVKTSMNELAISTLSLGIMANSTDPLDHVYGILGLLPKYVADKIIIDYSMPVYQAYAHLSRAIIEGMQNLDCLFLRNQKQNMKPTWCMDWAKGFDRVYTFHERSFNYDVHVESYEPARQFINFGKDRLTSRADKSLPLSIAVSEDGKLLRCQAIFLGNINGLSAEDLKLPNCLPVSQNPNTITQPTLSTSPYGDKDGVIKALLATFSMDPTIKDTPGNRIMFKIPWCGLEADADIETSTRNFGKGFQKLIANLNAEPSWAAHPTIGVSVATIEYLRRALASFHFAGKPFKEYFPPAGLDFEPMPEPKEVMSRNDITCLLGNLMGRRMAVLETGHFGLVPAVSEVGNEVWVLIGASMPVVLKKCKDVEDGQELFEVVGECYVEGFMSGEAVNSVEKGDTKLEDIVLC